MTELEQVLAGDSAHTPPATILEQIAPQAAHQSIPGAPHTIFEELWHIVYWQRITLDWIRGLETPIPDHAVEGFPTAEQAAKESWDQLRQSFLETLDQAVAAARDQAHTEKPIRCPSRPGMPVRVMTVREQLESLGAHDAYHLGRIVLLRQLLGAWPPPSGGFTW